ncbi:MAG TPA: peptidyl-alpha-hydroxyglycine alpha-amidating lyase family protein, partial [Pirellulales bacterium]|nr:peptidyl-alpha-hydroxyglycine alpha-amidating lyase family protein [Pirellulales bacterium]
MFIFRFPLMLVGACGVVICPTSLTAYPPNYLKTDTAITYEVDATWPQRPDSVAPLGAVSGIAVDADDRVWLFNRGPDPVQVYSADGKFIRTWGRDTIGKAHHLKIDKDGNIWVADIGHHVIRKYSPGGEVLLTIGTPDKPGQDDTHYNLPTDMAMGPTGDLYISDGYGNNRVVHCDSQGRFVRAWGKLGVAPGEFNRPHAIACDSTGRVFVADRNNVRVQVFDSAGKFLDAWTNLVVPWGITMTK